MSDDARIAVDTVTIAALMHTVHALHGELLRCPETRARLAAIEADTLRSVKQIDAGDFDYAVQAEGIGEALRLVRTMFRYSHATEQQQKLAQSSGVTEGTRAGSELLGP
ncbi:hypothetical protein [Alsobacter sp. R-9]